MARRVVCRTLTVVGGAAAGTAIAWFLSSGTATADTPVDPIGDAAPVLSQVATPFGAAVDAVDAVDTLADQLPTPPSPPAEALDELTATADQLGHRTQLPDGDLAEVFETFETAELPVQVADPAPEEAGSPPAPVAAAPARATDTATDTGVDPEHTAARTATERAYATGMPHRGSPGPARPDQPTWPAPFSPIPPSAPASGHTGNAGALADTSPSAALPWPDRTPASVHALTAPAADAATAGRAGDQPGTAPD